MDTIGLFGVVAGLSFGQMVTNLCMQVVGKTKLTFNFIHVQMVIMPSHIIFTHLDSCTQVILMKAK